MYRGFEVSDVRGWGVGFGPEASGFRAGVRVSCRKVMQGLWRVTKTNGSDPYIAGITSKLHAGGPVVHRHWSDSSRLLGTGWRLKQGPRRIALSQVFRSVEVLPY